MAGASSQNLGNVSFMGVLSSVLTPTAATLSTSTEQTFTVPGLQVGDVVCVQKPTFQAGIAVVHARVSAANTLAITFGNFTAGGITPTAGERYVIFYARFENQNVASPPGALV